MSRVEVMQQLILAFPDAEDIDVSNMFSTMPDEVAMMYVRDEFLGDALKSFLEKRLEPSIGSLTKSLWTYMLGKGLLTEVWQNETVNFDVIVKESYIKEGSAH